MRSVDEYSFPFSSHTLSIFSHLSSFQQQLLSLHITPLLLFTSSLSNAITGIMNEMYPVYLIADHFSDLRFFTEFSQLKQDNAVLISCLLEVNNSLVISLPSPLSLDSPFLSAEHFNILTRSTYTSIQKYHQSQLQPQQPQPQQSLSSPVSSVQPLPTVSLSTRLQSKVSYSLQLEQSFLSNTDLSEMIDLDSCVLILPPFLLAQPQHTTQPINASDFTYQTERHAMHIVANWGDIQHEIQYQSSHSCYGKSMIVENSLHCSEGFYPYIRNTIPNSSLYRLTMQLAGGWISEFLILEKSGCHFEEHAKELAQILAVREYYRMYFANHASK